MSRSFGPAHPQHLDAVGPHGLRMRLVAIPVTLHPMILLVLGLLAWGVTRDLLAVPIWMAIGVLSALLHETGHALTAFAFGARPSIEIGWRGGVTRWPGAHTLGRGAELTVLAMGPLVGLGVAAAAWWASRVLATPMIIDRAPARAAARAAELAGFDAPLTAGVSSGDALGLALGAAFLVSLTLALVDLLPAFPLDGGRALMALRSDAGFSAVLAVAHVGVVVTAVAAVGLILAGYPLLAAAPAVYLCINGFLVIQGDLAIGRRPADAIPAGDFVSVRRRIEAGVDGLEVAVAAQQAAQAADDHIAVTEIGIAAMARGWRFHDMIARTASGFASLRQTQRALNLVVQAVAMGANARELRRDPALDALAELPGWPHPANELGVDIRLPDAAPTSVQAHASGSDWFA